ncbi:MAG: hypothetical protein ACLQOO_25100 [Terriglobia bacterium]
MLVQSGTPRDRRAVEQMATGDLEGIGGGAMKEPLEAAAVQQ